jgi:hypothetical protein
MHFGQQSLSAHAQQLIESDVVLALNEQCLVPDAHTWVKPERYVGDFWAGWVEPGKDYRSRMNTPRGAANGWPE